MSELRESMESLLEFRDGGKVVDSETVTLLKIFRNQPRLTKKRVIGMIPAKRGMRKGQYDKAFVDLYKRKYISSDKASNTFSITDKGIAYLHKHKRSLRSKKDYAKYDYDKRKRRWTKRETPGSSREKMNRVISMRAPLQPEM